MSPARLRLASRIVEDIRVPVPNGHINVWYRAGAEGSQTVIMAHGLTGNSRWWSRVIPHLPDTFGVLALDVRGRGDSADSPPPYDLVEMGEDMVRCLDHFGVERAIGAGYSMGAWIAAISALNHPERYERVVLLDGGLALPNDPTLDPDDIIEAVVGPSLARLDLVFETESEYFELWKSHPALADHWDDAMRPSLAHELKRSGGGFSPVVNPEAVRVSARQITVDDETRNAATAIGVRAHLVVVERGTADQEGGMIPLDTARSAAASNPNITVTYLEDLNHYTLLIGDGAIHVAQAISG